MIKFRNVAQPLEFPKDAPPGLEGLDWCHQSQCSDQGPSLAPWPMHPPPLHKSHTRGHRLAVQLAIKLSAGLIYSGLGTPYLAERPSEGAWFTIPSNLLLLADEDKSLMAAVTSPETYP